MFLAVAPPHPMVGTWRVTYPWHTEIRNGVAVPYQEHGELRVEGTGKHTRHVKQRPGDEPFVSSSDLR